MRISIGNWLVTYFNYAIESYTILNCCPHNAKNSSRTAVSWRSEAFFPWLYNICWTWNWRAWHSKLIDCNRLFFAWSEYKCITNYDRKGMAIWNLIRENSCCSSNEYSDSIWAIDLKSHDECWALVSSLKIELHVLWFAGDFTKLKSYYRLDWRVESFNLNDICSIKRIVYRMINSYSMTYNVAKWINGKLFGRPSYGWW